MEKYNNDITVTFNGTEIEQRLIALIRTRSKGISDEDLNKEMPDLKPVQRAEIINKFLSQGHIELFKRAGLLFYRFQEDSTKLIKSVTNEEKIVYKTIEEVENKGIWIGDIKRKTNLTHTQLQQILKNLEAKQLIKNVKSKNNRKMYMLYHLESDIFTSNVWYQNNDIETEFIDVLSQQCYRFLKEKREKIESCHIGPIATRNAMSASSQEVWKFISDLGISKVELSVRDIEMILNILIYDGKIERIFSDDKNLYKSIRPLVNLPGLMRSPCGLCPVIKQCGDNDKGTFTPINCQYLREWLE